MTEKTSLIKPQFGALDESSKASQLMRNTTLYSFVNESNAPQRLYEELMERWHKWVDMVSSELWDRRFEYGDFSLKGVRQRADKKALRMKLCTPAGIQLYLTRPLEKHFRIVEN